MDKQKLFNINNFLASDTGRLTSLSIKRDLSLGGNKQKKIYKPNLNVVRNKNKGKPVINKIQQQSKRNLRNAANKNSQNQRYVQSTSVFSEGAGDLKRPTIHSDRYLNNSERDPSSMTMPKIVKTNWDINAKEESNIVDELLAEDENCSSDEDQEYNPVVLPLKDNKEGFFKLFKIKKEDPHKKEIKEEISSPVHNNFINYEVPLSFQDNKFYDDDHPCLSLLRMPDSLPGKGFAEDTDEIIDYDLNQMTEGKIGKVLIRKSGKVEIKIGKMTYTLDTIESNPFKEDLMYVPNGSKAESFGSEMVNFGNIDEKYVLSPTWKDLFRLKKNRK